mmetsp:Transcript_19990/g.63705  ORF Transcript_19990/g.63705 Transcript_19990/m.63705 type:complete len:542 (-) Transcript_19990:1264-2889(-)
MRKHQEGLAVRVSVGHATHDIAAARKAHLLQPRVCRALHAAFSGAPVGDLAGNAVTTIGHAARTRWVGGTRCPIVLEGGRPILVEVVQPLIHRADEPAEERSAGVFRTRLPHREGFVPQEGALIFEAEGAVGNLIAEPALSEPGLGRGVVDGEEEVAARVVLALTYPRRSSWRLRVVVASEPSGLARRVVDVVAFLRERGLVRERIVALLIRDICAVVRLDAPAGGEIPSLAVSHKVARRVEGHRGAARTAPAAVLDRPLLAILVVVFAAQMLLVTAHVVVDVELFVARWYVETRNLWNHVVPLRFRHVCGGLEDLRSRRRVVATFAFLRRDELDAAVPELLRFVVVVVRPAARVIRSDGDPQRAQQQFTALDSVLVELLLDGLRRVAGILDVACSWDDAGGRGELRLAPPHFESGWHPRAAGGGQRKDFPVTCTRERDGVLDALAPGLDLGVGEIRVAVRSHFGAARIAPIAGGRIAPSAGTRVVRSLGAHGKRGVVQRVRSFPRDRRPFSLVLGADGGHLPETSATANVEVVEAHPRLL